MRILQHFRRRGESGDNLILSLSEFRFSHLAGVVYIIFFFFLPTLISLKPKSNLVAAGV